MSLYEDAHRALHEKFDTTRLAAALEEMDAHELDELPKKRAIFVDFVEAFSLGSAHVQHAHAQNLQTGALNHGEDVPDVVLLDGVGLDDAEGAFDSHLAPLF